MKAQLQLDIICIDYGISLWTLNLNFWFLHLAHLFLGSFSHSSLQDLSSSIRLDGERRCSCDFFIFKRFAKNSKNLFLFIVCRILRKKMNLIHFGIRLYHNKMWKKWSAVNTFRMHCTSSMSIISIFHYDWHIALVSLFNSHTSYVIVAPSAQDYCLKWKMHQVLRSVQGLIHE